MGALEIVLVLLTAAAALRLVAERFGIPYPALLVVGGALLAFAPGLPDVDLSPDVLFLVFVPPLLYAGAVDYPLRDFRQQLGPIVRLAVLMVLVTMIGVAVFVHAWDPVFTWPAAFALGAIVAPPDPVAVLAMLRTLRVPRSVESILEGEGLFNDATALVAYRMAVAAAVAGTFDARSAAMRFGFAAVGGTAVGLAVGVVLLRAHRLARPVPAVENTISLLTPFASYLAAERIGASGVIAVVATGMYSARAVPRLVRPEARVQSRALWNVVTFLLESLVFILVGLELPRVAAVFAQHSFGALLGEAALVTLVAIAIRMIWIGPSAYLGRLSGRLLGRPSAGLPSWREVLFVGWAGLRGGDSLVIALALPLVTAAGTAFPARPQILFITFVVIFTTLVLQGPTLRPIARLLRLHGDTQEELEEAHARLAAVEAGLRALSSPEVQRSARPEVIEYLARRGRQRARRWAARESRSGGSVAEAHDALAIARPHEHLVPAPSHASGELDERRAAEYRRARAAMLRAEEEAVLDLRDQGVIDDDVMRRIQRDLDFESMLLETREPVIDLPSEVSSEMDEPER